MCRAVKSIISSGVISWHRKIFLAHDSLNEYKDAAEELFAIQSVKDLGWDDRYRIPFIAYIDFLQKKHLPSAPEEDTDKVIEDIPEEGEIEVEETDEERDWEKDYEDEKRTDRPGRGSGAGADRGTDLHGNGADRLYRYRDHLRQGGGYDPGSGLPLQDALPEDHFHG